MSKGVWVNKNKEWNFKLDDSEVALHFPDSSSCVTLFQQKIIIDVNASAKRFPKVCKLLTNKPDTSI